MKVFVLLIWGVICACDVRAQSVGVNTATPHASAILEVNSSNKGFLPPRMSTAERDAIPGPTPGLMIYNTSTNAMEFYTSYGWASMKFNTPFQFVFGGAQSHDCSSIDNTVDGGFVALGHRYNEYIIPWRFNQGGYFFDDTLVNASYVLPEYVDLRGITGTPDGGYIAVSVTTTFVFPGPVDHRDILVIKFNSSGSREWHKVFGGSNEEAASVIRTTSDGGYILSGFSTSSNSGHVTGTNNGNADCWVIKLDALGNISWQKLIGGSNADRAVGVRQAADGGYIVLATSTSSQSGNITATNHGMGDYLLLKLDASGNLLWHKLLGGNQNEVARSLELAHDGNFILAGESSSSANGDVSGTNNGMFSPDYWVLKTDQNGNIVWQKLLGGNSLELLKEIRRTADNGFIIAGSTSSSTSGNVTGANHGADDYWVVKLNANGNIIWDRVLGGIGWQNANCIVERPDGTLIVGGNTTSGQNGDITLPLYGGKDAWLIKLNANGMIIQ